jgi:hypothetical protein
MQSQAGATRRRILSWPLMILLCAMVSGAGSRQELATDRVIGQLEVVAVFNGPMPTGVRSPGTVGSS